MSAQDIGLQIGEGADATVHTHGKHVLKLWKDRDAKAPAFLEAQNLTIAASHDLPVPQVHAVGRYDNRWGIIMDRVTGSPLADQLKSAAAPDTADCLAKMAALHLRLHEKPEPRLRQLKSKLATAIHAATRLDPAHIARLIAHLGTLPDGQHLCHGDFHPFNLLGPPDHLIIIDWLDATSGPPAADVCRAHIILSIVSTGLADDYVTRYAEISELTPDDILIWRPVIAAARLRENPPDVENLIEMAKQI